MSTHTKQKELDSKSGDSAQPMNVNINIACSIDPQTGASQCRISYPDSIPSEEDDIIERIELARKKDLEEDAEEEEELEKKSLKSKSKKPSRHDSNGDDDEEDEKDLDSADSNEDDDWDDEDYEDEILECITKSTMRKR